MKLSRVAQAAATEVAFAAGAAGLLVAALALFGVAAPRQMQDLCVSTRALVVSQGWSWSCGRDDRSGGDRQPGQLILSH